MEEQQQKRRITRKHAQVDAIYFVQAMHEFNLTAGQLSTMLGYSGNGTGHHWIKSGKMPVTAKVALDGLYAQRATQQIKEAGKDKINVAQSPAPMAALGGVSYAALKKPDEVFYRVVKFVNDEAVSRTTLSSPKTMTIDGKTYVLLPTN